MVEKNKNWSGDKNSVFKTLGASNHTEKEREQNDFYATEPKAMELLLEVETFNNVWECACGQGHLAKVLDSYNILGKASDLIYRGYGIGNTNFLSLTKDKDLWNGDIITNPPYKYSQEFIEKSLELINIGSKVAMFLPIQFLEGKRRKKFYLKYPPKVVYVSSSRLNCAMNGDFEKYKYNSARAYAWFVWVKGFTGDTIVKWIN